MSVSDSEMEKAYLAAQTFHAPPDVAGAESVYALIDADLKAAINTIKVIQGFSEWTAECATHRCLYNALLRANRDRVAQIVKAVDLKVLKRRWMCAGKRKREFARTLVAQHRLLLPDQFWHQVGVALGVFEEKEEKYEQDHQIT